MSDRNAKYTTLLERVLQGESVDIVVFTVKEDFLYSGKKDEAGQPQFSRVISIVYFDEEDDNPSTEDFDGTLESFIQCLDAHDACDFDTEFGDSLDATQIATSNEVCDEPTT